MTAVEFLVDELNKEMGLISFVTGAEESYKSAIFSIIEQAKEMERGRTLKLCYGVWRFAKSEANYLYITKDSGLLGYAEPLSEEDRIRIDVELFIAIRPI